MNVCEKHLTPQSTEGQGEGGGGATENHLFFSHPRTPFYRLWGRLADSLIALGARVCALGAAAAHTMRRSKWHRLEISPMCKDHG
jgi:hypothetical protein